MNECVLAGVFMQVAVNYSQPVSYVNRMMIANVNRMMIAMLIEWW